MGDFNGDADPDLAVTNRDSDNVSVLLGATGGSFETADELRRRLIVPSRSRSGDFNGDSDPDLAVANRSSGNVSILLGAAGGDFTGPTNFAAGAGPRSVAVGDFNGDSDPDLAVANRASGNVGILLGAAGGTFTGPTSYAVNGPPHSVAVGDFNGDSDPDLAVANHSTDNVTILLGAAGGSFTGPTSFAVGDGSNSVAVGDFNGDSDPDLAVANRLSNTVSILLGTAGGGFTYTTTLGAGVEPRSITVGDFNGDSDPDLAVANGSSGTVSILLGAAGGSFTGPTNFAVGSPRQFGSNTFFPHSVAVGDFNGDSDPDLAVANGASPVAHGSDDVSILLGAAGGSFTGPTDFGAGWVPHGVAVGDFNADAAPDIVVANQGSDNVAILLNNTPVNAYPRPAGATPIRVALVPALRPMHRTEPHPRPAARIRIVCAAHSQLVQPSGRRGGHQLFDRVCPLHGPAGGAQPRPMTRTSGFSSDSRT